MDERLVTIRRAERHPRAASADTNDRPHLLAGEPVAVEAEELRDVEERAEGEGRAEDGVRQREPGEAARGPLQAGPSWAEGGRAEAEGTVRLREPGGVDDAHELASSRAVSGRLG